MNVPDNSMTLRNNSSVFLLITLHVTYKLLDYLNFKASKVLFNNIGDR